MATSYGLFLATIYNQSQLAERKYVARYWSINTAATAVPLITHSSPLVITTKLAAAILGGRLFGGGVLPAQYCPVVARVEMCVGSVPNTSRLRHHSRSSLMPPLMSPAAISDRPSTWSCFLTDELSRMTALEVY